MVEHLLSKGEFLSSNPSNTHKREKKKKKKRNSELHGKSS
jgi:hypothetical protein